MPRFEQAQHKSQRNRHREGDAVPTFPEGYKGKRAAGGGDRTDEILLDITEVLHEQDRNKHLGHLGVEASK